MPKADKVESYHQPFYLELRVLMHTEIETRTAQTVRLILQNCKSEEDIADSPGKLGDPGDQPGMESGRGKDDGNP
jgi:hypothetical protein